MKAGMLGADAELRLLHSWHDDQGDTSSAG